MATDETAHQLTFPFCVPLTPSECHDAPAANITRLHAPTALRLSIKDWPRADRPRDKLLDRGATRSPTPSCSPFFFAPASAAAPLLIRLALCSPPPATTGVRSRRSAPVTSTASALETPRSPRC